MASVTNKVWHTPHAYPWCRMVQRRRCIRYAFVNYSATGMAELVFDHICRCKDKIGKQSLSVSRARIRKKDVTMGQYVERVGGFMKVSA